MILSFLCIPHIPVGYAGGRATQEQLPRHEEHEVLFLRVLRAFVVNFFKFFKTHKPLIFRPIAVILSRSQRWAGSLSCNGCQIMTNW
ncbi:hypothetical protein B0F87_10320 [Methylobacter tundripaludum]|uniref:Uncharacterized protein n=1 Tax=Methylobacter tundripaludum TaxID=173365 RepID=A0A2S6HFZ8_9GAMM|nr:hypothetical protein B0F87_10320 [Methylobacter tundripaludum]